MFLAQTNLQGNRSLYNTYKITMLSNCLAFCWWCDECEIAYGS